MWSQVLGNLLRSPDVSGYEVGFDYANLNDTRANSGGIICLRL